MVHLRRTLVLAGCFLIPAVVKSSSSDYNSWSRPSSSFDRKQPLRDQNQQQHQQRQPGGPAWSSNNNPIHYEFPQSGDQQQQQQQQQQDERPASEIPSKSATARRDPVTQFQRQSFGHRQFLSLSSGVVGVLFGNFMTKSLHLPSFPLVFFAISFITSHLRNIYGEWLRVLGLWAIRVLQAYPRIRKDYPAFRSTTLPRQEQRLLVLIALGIIGALMGGTLPILPASIGSLAGAGTLVVTGMGTTTPLSNLIWRCGRRAVALGTCVYETQDDLRVVATTGRMAGRILDRLLFLDRQHRIRETLGNLMGRVIAQASRNGNASGGDGRERAEFDDNRSRRSGRDDSEDRRGPPPRRRRQQHQRRDEFEFDEGRRKRRPDPQSRDDDDDNRRDSVKQVDKTSKGRRFGLFGRRGRSQPVDSVVSKDDRGPTYDDRADPDETPEWNDWDDWDGDSRAYRAEASAQSNPTNWWDRTDSHDAATPEAHYEESWERPPPPPPRP